MPVDAPTDSIDTIATAARVRPATVAIVGRPNVGKSALFNRLIGKRMAIVDDTPGVTRDRLYALAEWRGRTFSVIDTAGIDPDALDSDDMARQTRAQAEIAANDADVIVFVVDAAAGLSPLDDDVVHIMRKTRHPVVLAANKAESDRVKREIPGEFARLGFGEPIAISALHGEGTGDLLDAIFERLPAENELALEDTELALAIVGRPNVGKSSLLNALIGEDRSIVSNVPGTTRDAIDTLFQFGEHRIRLIDTAGVWRKTKHHGSIEYYASLRSLGAIARCDIAILVMDSMQGILDQDRRLAGMVLEERKGLIIAANKWDLALAQDEDYSQSELTDVIHENVPFASFAPVTFLSALTKRRPQQFDAARDARGDESRSARADAAAQRHRARRSLRAPRTDARRQTAARLLRRAGRDASAALHLPLQRSGSRDAELQALPRKHAALELRFRRRAARARISRPA